MNVSVIVPARNEALHIETCVRSILAQRFPGEIEVIVSDGSSSDATAAIAREAGARMVSNAEGSTPAGLNAALAAASNEIVVRFDAHAEMPQGYVAACVRALTEEPGAAAVGGWRTVSPRGAWGKAAGAALASRFGVGNPRLWRRPSAPGRVDVDTVALGCWWTEELRGAGGWDTRFVRNQDFELNHRLRERGGRVVFDPAIWSVYHPRESLAAIAAQYRDYGRFKALMLMTAPRSLRPRQLAPLALLGTAFAASRPNRLGRAARAGLGAYAFVLASVAAHSRGGWRTVPVLATMHGAWSLGLVGGLIANAADRISDPGQRPRPHRRRG